MNKYEVLGVVGEGAYGVVLKCRHRQSNELVAVKKFKQSQDDQAVRKTTVRQVKILRILKHPNVVQWKQAFRRQGKLYLVFQYVQQNLLQVLQQHPQGLDVIFNQSETVRSFIFQLCQAIDYCHRHQVVHRDIKPQNLLISSSNSLKLCDFGFARTLPQRAVNLTDYVATRWYRAPELLLGTSEYGKSVDMWATACIMGEITDGQPLFPGESEIDQLYVIQKVMGSLTTQQQENFQKNPRFIGLRFPEISRPETLENKYRGKMSRLALSFMNSLLKMEPKQRMTAGQALSHPYFDGLRGETRGRNRPNKQKNRLHSSQNYTPTENRRSVLKLKQESCSPQPVFFKETQIDIKRPRRKQKTVENQDLNWQRSKEMLKSSEYISFKSRNKKRNQESGNLAVDDSPKGKFKRHKNEILHRGISRGLVRVKELEDMPNQSARQLPSLNYHKKEPDTGGGPPFLRR